ncbi:hypothetical protein [Micromonospora sp. DT41]|uniref:hypothetical protein n=1 Tax=Micromonospora sp. DT41 TaxID=3393437 RepID=UPI003CF6C2A2
MTGHGLPPHVQRALAADAKGFLPMGAPGGTLADGDRRGHASGRYVDAALAADALTAPECPLTPARTGRAPTGRVRHSGGRGDPA